MKYALGNDKVCPAYWSSCVEHTLKTKESRKQWDPFCCVLRVQVQRGWIGQYTFLSFYQERSIWGQFILIWWREEDFHRLKGYKKSDEGPQAQSKGKNYAITHSSQLLEVLNRNYLQTKKENYLIWGPWRYKRTLSWLVLSCVCL